MHREIEIGESNKVEERNFWRHDVIKREKEKKKEMYRKRDGRRTRRHKEI